MNPNGGQFGLLGLGGVLWLDDALQPQSFQAIVRGEADGNIVSADLDGDGRPEVVSHGGDFGSRFVTAFNLDGQLLWRTRVKFPTDNLSAGTVEFLAPLNCPENGARFAVVGKHNNDVLLLDAQGKVVGTQKWDYLNMPFTSRLEDVDGDGLPESLYGTAGELVLRNHDGSERWRARLVPRGGYINYLRPEEPSEGPHRWCVNVSVERGYNTFVTKQFAVTDGGRYAEFEWIKGGERVVGQVERTFQVPQMGGELLISTKYDQEGRRVALVVRSADGRTLAQSPLDGDLKGYLPWDWLRDCVRVRNDRAATTVLFAAGTKLYAIYLCPRCGYSRAGLTPDSPCPECGHTQER